MRKKKTRARRPKKTAFSLWLEKQLRNKLTYWKLFPLLGPLDRMGPVDRGWTGEDFTLEAMARGIKASYQTTCKRMAGGRPKQESMGPLRSSFPGITF